MEKILLIKTIIVAIWFGALFAVENLKPAAKRPENKKHQRKAVNIILWGINIIISPLIVIPLSNFATGIQIHWRPDILTGAYGLIFDIIFLDFYLYWWHRAVHEIKFFWRFHEIHHLDQFLDTTTAVRFHFCEVILSALFRVIIIILMDIPLSSVILFEALILMSALFHHSNWKLPEKIENKLSKIIITPSIHWVHHEVKQKNTDSNYGAIFVFWDKLFGTKNKMDRELDMSLGVDDLKDRNLFKLLLRPFNRSKY